MALEAYAEDTPPPRQQRQRLTVVPVATVQLAHRIDEVSATWAALEAAEIESPGQSAAFTRAWVSAFGIAEADLPKLGNPFVQASNSYNRSHDGAGLGLSVVKGLARLHGGRVELASALGKGTTVTILLPLDAGHESFEPGGEPLERPASAA